jgi:hypothetical protein
MLLSRHALGHTTGLLRTSPIGGGPGAHRAHTPDLEDGATSGAVDEGVEHAEGICFEEIVRRGTAAAALPSRLVDAGFALACSPRLRPLTRPVTPRSSPFWRDLPPNRTSPA